MSKKFVIVCILPVVAFWLMDTSLVKAKEQSLLIANFNDCKKPNQLGGNFGAWDRAPTDFTQTAMISFIDSINHGE